MFTKNWYRLLAVTSCMPSNTVSGLVDLSGSAITSTGPSTSYAGHYVLSHLMQQPRTAFGNSGVFFGNGNELATLEDYKLSGDYISTFQSMVATSYENEADSSSITCNYTLANTGDTDIVISEVGIITYAWKGATSNNGWMLIERTVLEEPVTIEPGGVGQVTYTIRFNYPT